MGARAVAVRAPRAGRRMVKTASSSSGRFESRASASMTSRAREMEQTLEVQAEGEGVEDEMREIAVDARAPRVRRDRAKTASRELKRRFQSRDARCVILAGGADETNPLTRRRARSAVHLAGTYRVIDFPMTNLINSGMRQLYVLTQFNSHSLVTHVNKAFPSELFGGEVNGFVEVLPTSQTREHGETWSLGSADCVARHLSSGSLTKYTYELRMEDECLRQLGSFDECLMSDLDGTTIILSAEALYSMNFAELLEQHFLKGADVTIATCNQISSDQANAFGILDVDEMTAQVNCFIEKPTKAQLEEFMQCTTEELESCKLDANMGVYVFNNSALLELLTASKSGVAPGDRHEFGKDVIPYAIDMGYDVKAFRHSDYWKPLRSLRDLYEANISIAVGGDAASLLTHGRQVYTKPNFLPPTTFHGSVYTEKTIFSDGCLVQDGSRIVNSVIGACTSIDKNVDLEGVVVVGRDEIMKRSGGVSSVPDIGANTIIRKCIIDSDATIGANVRIVNAAGIEELDRTDEGYVITEGIVTILGGAIIPDGFVI